MIAARSFEERALDGAGPVGTEEIAVGCCDAICELKAPEVTVAMQALKFWVGVVFAEENNLSRSL